MSIDLTWLQKLKKGDTVYCVPDSRSRFNEAYRAQVVSVGPKYVTCARICGGLILPGTFRIRKDRWFDGEFAMVQQNFGTGDAVYSSEEAYLEIKRIQRLYNAVQERFNYGRVPDDKMLQIAAILEIE